MTIGITRSGSSRWKKLLKTRGSCWRLTERNAENEGLVQFDLLTAILKDETLKTLLCVYSP